jgi:hypothetical protein
VKVKCEGVGQSERYVDRKRVKATDALFGRETDAMMRKCGVRSRGADEACGKSLSFLLEVGGCLGEGSEWRLGLDPFYFFSCSPRSPARARLSRANKVQEQKRPSQPKQESG